MEGLQKNVPTAQTVGTLEILITIHQQSIPEASASRKVIYLSKELQASRIWRDAQTHYLASKNYREVR